MPATVLIADAERGLLSLMEAGLTEEGFQLLTSSSGQGALTLARQENPDLIILDLVLPDMDGYEFMRHRCQEDQTPIIMLAAASGGEISLLSFELPRVLLVRAIARIAWLR